MKKIYKDREILSGNFPRQLFLTMKLTLFILITSVLSSLATGSYSQNTRVTLDLKSVTVKDVLKAIESSSEFFFVYNNELINVDRKIDLNVKNEMIGDVLSKIFDGRNVEVTVLDRKIVLAPTYMSSQQPAKKITGKVTDQSGVPIPGASVVLKGTTTGVITDVTGNFSINSIPENTILQFSFVGMKSQEINVGNKGTINVAMEEETIALDEVVAIGYGTVKTVNLTGSVASVSSNELLKRPVSNVQNLLQGKVSGLDIIQNTGRPGFDEASMTIRGIGTFSSAGSSPMVIIDGVQGELSTLNVNDIESLSVLKDAASAAIYGARASNGVILVTTKKGTEQKPTIEYDGNFQLQQATVLPQMLTNSADYMTLFNDANVRGGKPSYFSQAQIDAYRSHEGQNDPRYPNFNWANYMYHTAPAQNHYLALSGGNKNTTYRMSLGYFDQDGIVLDLNNLKKYSGKMSIDSKVSNAIKVGGVVDLSMWNRIAPATDLLSYGASYDEMSIAIVSAPPMMTPYLSDGSGRISGKYSNTIGEWTTRGPIGESQGGKELANNLAINAQVYADINITKELIWSTKGNIHINNYKTKYYEVEVPTYYFDTGEFYSGNYPTKPGVTDSQAGTVSTTLSSILTFKKTFHVDHSVGTMIGYNQEYSKNENISAYRKHYSDPSLHEVDAGESTDQVAHGNASEWAIQSLFGRLTYNYKEKYLLEGNVRCDGSSRLSPSGRWGVFPSVSAGWRISNEGFFEPYKSLINNLKLRVSWGKLGNQNIGNYPYQSLFAQSPYPFDALHPGVTINAMVNPYLHWELTTEEDLGLDLSIKEGLFTLTADWYNKLTTDILYGVPIPSNLGMTYGPTENNGAMRNRGIEIAVGHNNTIGKMKYGVNFNISMNRNKLINIIAPTFGYYNIIQEGLPWNQFYLYQMDGVFQSQEDINNSPTQSFNPKPGDLKFKDQPTLDSNGDGIPDKGDGKITSLDKVPVDGMYPKFTYGFNLNLSWKNFDLTAFFQGSEGRKCYFSNWAFAPFTQGSAPTQYFVDHMWTPDRPSNTTPAIHYSNYPGVAGLPNTWYLQDCSYLRLKNLLISYKIPELITKKIGIKDLRIYTSGDNILTFTKLKNADPERISSNMGLAFPPQLRIFTFGIKLKI